MMKDAPKLLDRLSPTTPSTSRRFARCSTTPGCQRIDPTLVRGTTTTRARCSSSERRARRAIGGRRRRALDRLIEQLGGPPLPAWAGPQASSGCCSRAGAYRSTRSPVDLFVAIAERDADHSRAAFGLARDARRAGLNAQLELTDCRSGQLKHGTGRDRYVAIVGSDVVLKNMESGEQHETETANVIPTILRGSRLS